MSHQDSPVLVIGYTAGYIVETDFGDLTGPVDLGPGVDLLGVTVVIRPGNGKHRSGGSSTTNRNGEGMAEAAQQQSQQGNKKQRPFHGRFLLIVRLFFGL